MESLIHSFDKVCISKECIVIQRWFRKILKKQKIKFLLTNLIENKVEHLKNILCEETLKDAHIYCKINNLSGQISGVILESYIINKYKMIKSKSSECIGDCSKNNKTIEIKVSLGGKTHNNFNYVQLRPNHKIDYYILTAYIINNSNINDLGDLYIFQINKESMLILIKKYGAYAHGTIAKLGKIDIIDEKSDKEYCIRPKYQSKCWKELLRFRVYDICIK